MDSVSLFGQAKTTAPALAQPGTKADLQLPHLHGDGGLAHIEFGLRRRQSAAADHRVEHSQQAQVHVVQLLHMSPNLMPCTKTVTSTITDLIIKYLAFY